MNTPTNNTGVHLWLILNKAEKALAAQANASILKLGLCPSDFAVLEVLLHKGPLPVNQIGQKVLLTSGSMTAAVDRLEEKNLLQRSDSKKDRRAKIVSLTPQGKRLIQTLFHEHAAHLEAATAALNEKEKTQLVALLKKLGKSVSQKGEQS